MVGLGWCPSASAAPTPLAGVLTRAGSSAVLGLVLYTAHGHDLDPNQGSCSLRDVLSPVPLPLSTLCLQLWR